MLRRLLSVLIFLFSTGLFAQTFEGYQVEEFKVPQKGLYYLIPEGSTPDSVVIKRFGNLSLVSFQDLPNLKTYTALSNEWKLLGISFTEERINLDHDVNVYVRAGKTFGFPEAERIAPGLFLIRNANASLVRTLIDSPEVTCVQRADRMPEVESIIRQYEPSVNAITLAHHNYPSLNGEGFNVSVKENAFDSADFDIAGRAFLDAITSDVSEQHATEMATLIGGGGVSSRTGRGVAKAARLHSASFLNLFPESANYYNSKGITVQNHSYGIQVENFYGVESVGYDQIVFNIPELVHVFSLGNRGAGTGTGIYQDIPAYGTITGSFKQAKNILLVSSTDSLGQISELNSRGPAYDGRIKPDLVAFGGEGTSEGAALVSGGAVLIQEHYENIEGTLPSSDVIRALLIAGSDDMLDEGPDFISGYGAMNLDASLSILDQEQFLRDAVAQGETDNFIINIPAGTAQIQIALTWIDPPANDGDPMALVNDLDVSINVGGTDYEPWILDPTPNVVNLSSPPTRGVDRLNNTEFITLSDPQAGNATLTVSGFDVSGTQAYAVAYRFIGDNSFEWIYPTASDALFADESNRLGWRTSETGSATIELGYPDGSWQLLESNADLDTYFSRVELPDTTAIARLRMNTAFGSFVSDDFLLTQSTGLQVDLDCDSETIIKWDRLTGADNYTVYKYSNQTLEQVAAVTDTFLILDRSADPESFYSIIPTVDGRSGIQTNLINIDQQGVGCYLSNFLAVLNSQGGVDLQVNLAGLSRLDRLRMLKRERSDPTQSVIEDLQPTQSQYLFVDNQLTVGVTYYQLVLTTVEGDEFVSEEFAVFATDESTYALFPNPATEGFFYFLSPESNTILQLLDRSGRMILTQELAQESDAIDVSEVNSGLYFYRVVRDGQTLSTGRVLIRN